MTWVALPVDLIGTTTTKSGFTVTANRDTNADPIKINVSNEAMASLNISPQAFHGDWNDTITPLR